MKARHSRFALLAWMLWLPGVAGAATIDAGHADDVCAPGADPCVIHDVVRLRPNASLDFGLRAVEVADGGRLEFGYDGATIACGSFRTTAKGTAIDMRPSESIYGFTIAGSLGVDARRGCSDASPPYPCFQDSGCTLGSCDAHYCQKSESVLCSSDDDCQLGACSEITNHCDNGFQFCATNADCDLGSCAVELSCSEHDQGKRGCSGDADCELGSCSVGEGTIDLQSKMSGRGAQAGGLDLIAADSVSVTGAINMSSRHADYDGGQMFILTYAGDVLMAGKIRARSGRFGMGGEVEIDAGRDVTIAGDMDVRGGDFDGGTVFVFAGQDIAVSADIRADSRMGEGYGGEVFFDAQRDVTIAPGADSSDLRISLDGHRSSEGFAGDGGRLDIDGKRNVVVAAGVRIWSRGANGGGYGGEMNLYADGSASFDGEFDGTGRGPDSSGGYVQLVADGTLEIGTAGAIVVSAPGGRGGEVYVRSGLDAALSGVVVAEGDPTRTGGEVIFKSFADLALSGASTVGGGTDAVIEVEACRITLTGTASLTNESVSGTNRLTARESMRLEPGSTVFVAEGTNELIHRAAEKPPVVEGTVLPAPTVLVNAALAGCPECGNLEIDQSETCDDGNAADGDGCSVMCLIE